MCHYWAVFFCAIPVKNLMIVQNNSHLLSKQKSKTKFQRLVTPQRRRRIMRTQSSPMLSSTIQRISRIILCSKKMSWKKFTINTAAIHLDSSENTKWRGLVLSEMKNLRKHSIFLYFLSRYPNLNGSNNM